jgi:hypothetical protein
MLDRSLRELPLACDGALPSAAKVRPIRAPPSALPGRNHVAYAADGLSNLNCGTRAVKSVTSIERPRRWQRRNRASDFRICLACRGPIADCLARGGSLRCHDCRDDEAPLLAQPVRRRSAGVLSSTDTKKAA